MDEEKKPTFKQELTGLINKHGKDGMAGTPDFILAEFLCQCLGAYTNATVRNETWHGRPNPAEELYFKTAAPIESFE